jgi:hypothetical protein
MMMNFFHQISLANKKPMRIMQDWFLARITAMYNISLMRGSVVLFSKSVANIKRRMKTQFKYFKFRQEVLNKHWEAEVEIYKQELGKHAGVPKKQLKKEMREDLTTLSNWDLYYIPEYADKVLELWYNRCKYKHALAFF